MFFLDSVARTSPVLILLAGILAFESTSGKLITAAVQRRIYTGLSPLPLVADPHPNR
jgi:hypothetical protein